MNKHVKVLYVNAGVSPISTEVAEFSASDEEVKAAILAKLNSLGKSAHALLHRDGRYFVVDHTARKGHTKVYYESETKYHPYMKELL